MTIVVTGGAGFIGSNFILYWQSAHPNDRIVCLDKLTYAANVRTVQPMLSDPDFRFVRMDIVDEMTLDRIFDEEQPDLVVHFAAESHVDRSIESPTPFFETNIMGTAALLEVCRRHRTRLHLISTDEVYGTLEIDRPDLRFSEESPLHPSSPYSSSKASSDLLALAYHRTYGLPVTISRCSNNYGRYQFPEKLIPLMILAAVENRPLPVYGDGRQVRDWLHVDDHCRAVDLVIQKGRIGEVYNIGGQNEWRNIDLVHRICEILGRGADRICYLPDRLGHDVRYAVNATKIRTELGWRPEISFGAGLKQTVRWYLDHESWWRPILNGKYRNFAEMLPEWNQVEQMGTIDRTRGQTSIEQSNK